MAAPSIVRTHKTGRNFGATSLTNANGNNVAQIDMTGVDTILCWAQAVGASNLVQIGSVTIGSGGSQITLTPRTDRSMQSEFGVAGRMRAFDFVGATLTGLQNFSVNAVLVSDGTTPDNNAALDVVFELLSGGTALVSQNLTAVLKNPGEVLSASITSNTNSRVVSLGMSSGSTDTLSGVSPSNASILGIMFTYRAWQMDRVGAAGATTVSSTVGVQVAGYGGTTWTVEGSASASDLAGNAALGDVSLSGGLGGGSPTVLSGSAVLDDADAGGGVVSVSSQVAGDAVLDAVAAGGGLATAPGTLTVPELRNWSNMLLVSQLVENIAILRITRPVVLLAVQYDRTTHASTADLVLSDAALPPGTLCMAVGFNMDGTARFARAVTVV